MSDKKQLKIAVIIKRFISTGGAERYAQEVTRRLASRHEVHVFAQEWAFQTDEDITFHKIPRYVNKPTWLNHLLFSSLSSKAVGNGFDIIHSHEKVPRFDVMTIHSPCFRSFITREKREWKRNLLWFSVALSPRQLAWLSIEKKQLDFHPERIFIAVSERVKKDIQANYPLPDTSFRIAYPGVDEQMKRGLPASDDREESRSRLGLGQDDFVVLFVGTEFKRKGLDALLRAFSLIAASRYKLVVAGGGGGKMKKYKNLASDLGLTEQVVFLGLVENVGELYALADAVILPTLSDPWAMAPMEAMLAGIPAAVSSAEYCGAAEHIQNGEALIIANPLDPGEIKEAVIKLTDPGCRKELSRKGQALAAQLTWERTTASTLAAYDEVLRRKGKGPIP